MRTAETYTPVVEIEETTFITNNKDNEKQLFITDKDLLGEFAKYAVVLHPFNKPEGLFDICRLLKEEARKATKVWTELTHDMFLFYFENPFEIENWLKSIIYNHPILQEWNTSIAKNKDPFIFVSSFTSVRPEDDFIDIDALLRTVSMSLAKYAGYEVKCPVFENLEDAPINE